MVLGVKKKEPVKKAPAKKAAPKTAAEKPKEEVKVEVVKETPKPKKLSMDKLLDKHMKDYGPSLYARNGKVDPRAMKIIMKRALKEIK